MCRYLDRNPTLVSGLVFYRIYIAALCKKTFSVGKYKYLCYIHFMAEKLFRGRYGFKIVELNGKRGRKLQTCFEHPEVFYHLMDYHHSVQCPIVYAPQVCLVAQSRDGVSPACQQVSKNYFIHYYYYYYYKSIPSFES